MMMFQSTSGIFIMWILSLQDTSVLVNVTQTSIGDCDVYAKFMDYPTKTVPVFYSLQILICYRLMITEILVKTQIKFGPLARTGRQAATM